VAVTWGEAPQPNGEVLAGLQGLTVRWRPGVSSHNHLTLGKPRPGVAVRSSGLLVNAIAELAFASPSLSFPLPHSGIDADVRVGV